MRLYYVIKLGLKMIKIINLTFYYVKCPKMSSLKLSYVYPSMPLISCKIHSVRARYQNRNLLFLDAFSHRT